ncbi:MAG: glycosyltransferase [Chthonomonadaceae bacterium]|nr:glycosyltransferase [Chthonomonadaceae bacterium]
MRVAIFSECYTPVTNGVVTSILTLRSALRAMGHTVYVIAPGLPQPDDDADVFRLPELPFPRHPYHFARPFPRLSVDFQALHVDIVHCQHPFTVGRMGADLARKYGLPMVYTAHSLYDLMIECARSPLLRKMGPSAARSIVRRFCERAACVITPTRHTRDALRASGVRARFAVVPSGVAPPVSRPEAREAIRNRLGIAPDIPVLLYVGRLGPEKRLDLLLEAMRYLSGMSALTACGRDFRVVLVGDGQCRDALEKQARACRLQDRVCFVGAQPHATIGDWYAVGDIFVLPSPSETQGLVVVEAMAAGLPCVVVDQGGPRELVIHEATGLRVPLNAEAFAHATARLLQNPEICRHYGAQGRRHAARFSPEAMASAVIQVYRDALERPVTPPTPRVFSLPGRLRRHREQLKRAHSRVFARRKM